MGTETTRGHQPHGDSGRPITPPNETSGVQRPRGMDAADEIERLRHDLGLARMLMRNIHDNTEGHEALSPDQARWKLKIIRGMLEGWA